MLASSPIADGTTAARSAADCGTCPTEPAPARANPASAALDAASFDPERSLLEAWHARLAPGDAAEAAVVETIVAGVRRRRRVDRLEERLLDALADGVAESLPALAAVARCRARIERDRRLALEELRLLRDPARVPQRLARARRTDAAAGSGVPRHAGPEPSARAEDHRPAAAAPVRAPGEEERAAPRQAEPESVSPRVSPAGERSLRTALDRSAGRAQAGAVMTRHAAPDPAAAVRLPEGPPTTDPLALAIARAFPAPWRDRDRTPDWRGRTSVYALEAGRLGATARRDAVLPG